MRLIIVRFVNDIAVVYQVPQVVSGILAPEVFTGGEILHRRYPLCKYDVTAVVPAYLVGAALNQIPALPYGLLYV